MEPSAFDTASFYYPARLFDYWMAASLQLKKKSSAAIARRALCTSVTKDNLYHAIVRIWAIRRWNERDCRK